MAASFDPYHRWLGIPPEDQPADHYRLLGIARYEANADVIEMAADRQMLLLRTLQNGPHGALSQKLLNEVASAKVCLLNLARKEEYDTTLRRTEVAPPASGAASNLEGLLAEAEIGGPVLPPPLRRPRTARAWKAGAGIGLAIVGGIALWALLIRNPGRPVVKDAAAVRRDPVAVRPEEDEPPTARAQASPGPSDGAEDGTVDPGPSDDALPPLIVPKSDAIRAGESVAIGSWIDVLSHVDLASDAIRGNWTRTEKGLAASAHAILLLPVILEGDYELQVAFTRMSGQDTVGTVFPVPPTTCTLILSGWNGRAHGLSNVNRREANNNATTKRPGKLVNNRRYELSLQVRTAGEDASIEATAEGLPPIRWQGQTASLSPFWTWTKPGQPGVTCGRCAVIFHAVRLRLLTGKAMLLANPKKH